MASLASKIEIHIMQGKGYVWKAQDVVRLRQDHRIYGSLVGGVAQFKNQNCINGVPMELSSDETSLLLRKGWATLKGSTLGALSAMLPHLSTSVAPQSKRASASLSRGPSQQIHGSGKRKRNVSLEQELYYDYYEAIGAYEEVWDPEAMLRAASLPILPFVEELRGKRAADAEMASKQARRDLEGEATGGNGKGVEGARGHSDTQAQPSKTPVTSSAGPLSKSDELLTPPLAVSCSSQATVAPSQATALFADEAGEEATWTSALQEGSHFILPTTAEDARQQPGSGLRSPSGDPAVWTYPQTLDEILRFIVFCDLHEKGYTLSSGAKFGADLLAYPGDPSEFHAQFTVRPLLPSSAINPILLKSASRGSHTARKHLMLATVPGLLSLESRLKGLKPWEWPQDDPEFEVTYVSIGPEAGFGK